MLLQPDGQSGGSNKNQAEGSSSNGGGTDTGSGEAGGSEGSGGSNASGKTGGAGGDSASGENEKNMQANSTKAKNQQYLLQQSGVLTNSEQIDWNSVKTEVENLYLSIPTITLDLYKTDAKQDDVLKLNSELDNLTKAIKDEKKKDTLSELSKVYEIIRTVSDNCMDTEVEKVCIRVKENVLKAYSLLDTGDWATMAQNVKQGVDEFSKLMTQNKVETERQFAINKAYVMLNELQKAAERQDTEIFLIKYKNLLEDLSNL